MYQVLEADAARVRSHPRRGSDGPERNVPAAVSGGFTASAGSPGPSGGGGFALALFAMLLALIAVEAPPLLERLPSAAAHLRPVAFVSLLERPG